MKKIVNCVYKAERTFGVFDKLLDAGFQTDFNHLMHTQDERAVIDAVKGYDYVIAGSEIWSRKVFEAVADSLKMLVRNGVGMDSVDISAARELGIAVSNTPGANAMSVAEHALAMLLSFLRKITKYDSEMRNGIWEGRATRAFSGRLGLIGFGAIAKEFAKLVRSFPVEVYAYDTNFDDETAKLLNVRYLPLKDIVGECDFISLHVPVTEQTKNMVNAEFLRSMKKDAILINTSRGAIIDEAALCGALQNDMIGGALLDVFVEEPLHPSSPLLVLENTLLSPHIASSSSDAAFKVAACIASNIINFENGKSFPGLITPGRLVV